MIACVLLFAFVISILSGCGAGSALSTSDAHSGTTSNHGTQNKVVVEAKIVLQNPQDKDNANNELSVVFPDGTITHGYDEYLTHLQNMDLNNGLDINMSYYSKTTMKKGNENEINFIGKLAATISTPTQIFVGANINKNYSGIKIKLTDENCVFLARPTVTLCYIPIKEKDNIKWIIWNEAENKVTESECRADLIPPNIKLFNTNHNTKMSHDDWVWVGMLAIVVGLYAASLNPLFGIALMLAGVIIAAANADAQEPTNTPPPSNNNNGNQSGGGESGSENNGSTPVFHPEPTPIPVDDAMFLTSPGNSDSPAASEYNDVYKLAGEEFSIDFWVKNIGNTTWKAGSNYLWNNFAAGGFGNFPDHICLDHDVKPNEIWSNHFTFRMPSGIENYLLTCRMGKDPNTEFGSYINWNIIVPDALLVSQYIPEHPGYFDIAFGPGETRNIWVKFKNISNKTWHRTGDNPVHLGTSLPRDRVSVFVKSNRASDLEEESVAPGEIGTFRFNITAPTSTGTYYEHFEPVMEYVKWSGADVCFKIYVANPGAEYTTQGPVEHPGRFDVAFGPGETRTLWVRLKNTGDATWFREGANPVHLGTINPNDRASLFFSSMEGKRVLLKESEVIPGDIGTFEFTITAPTQSGIYYEHFQPVMEYVGWFGPDIYWKIYVASPDAEYITQGPHEGPEEIDISLHAGQQATLWTKVKNTGDATWFKNGNHPVHLGTTDPNDRTSIFFGNQNLRANLEEDIVVPGDTGTFSFTVTAPDAPGIYHEHFRPVMEYVTWFGPNIYWTIKVEN